MMGRSSLRNDCTAAIALASAMAFARHGTVLNGLFHVRAHYVSLKSRPPTRCVRFAHCAQTIRADQTTKRAARADFRLPALQAAPVLVDRLLARHKQPTGLFVSGLALVAP